MMILCLSVILYSSKLFFFELSKQDIPGTFHVNVCSFLIFHDLESTDISTPQQATSSKRPPCLQFRADRKTGGAHLEFSGRNAMHGKSRVSSAVKYDCFELDDSGNCFIRKTWLHCI